MEKANLIVGKRILGGMAVAFFTVWGLTLLLDFVDSLGGLRSKEHQTAGLATGHFMGTGIYDSPVERTDGAMSAYSQSHAPSEWMDRSAAPADGTMDPDGQEKALPPGNQPPGVVFVSAAIAPLHHELNRRFWGWHPNDMIKISDNISNYQLGVLEVTRRTTVALAERLSRLGASDAFHQNLESAMNWLMIKADQYWFPTPEAKYRDSLNELTAYMQRLKEGKASFYTRTDNLIPLLQVFEDLMGSCEENLVKTHEKTGEAVSHFKADDYFYYAQGVASAMGTILEAVAVDFGPTLDARRASEVLQEVISACHHAQEIHPFFITNASLGGILANHRANMAVPISHARFSLGVLIKALST
jgi:hypothetical protein